MLVYIGHPIDNTDDNTDRMLADAIEVVPLCAPTDQLVITYRPQRAMMSIDDTKPVEPATARAVLHVHNEAIRMADVCLFILANRLSVGTFTELAFALITNRRSQIITYCADASLTDYLEGSLTMKAIGVRVATNRVALVQHMREAMGTTDAVQPSPIRVVKDTTH